MFSSSSSSSRLRDVHCGLGVADPSAPVPSALVVVVVVEHFFCSSSKKIGQKKIEQNFFSNNDTPTAKGQPLLIQGRSRPTPTKGQPSPIQGRSRPSNPSPPLTPRADALNARRLGDGWDPPDGGQLETSQLNKVSSSLFSFSFPIFSFSFSFSSYKSTAHSMPQEGPKTIDPPHVKPKGPLTTSPWEDKNKEPSGNFKNKEQDNNNKEDNNVQNTEQEDNVKPRGPLTKSPRGKEPTGTTSGRQLADAQRILLLRAGDVERNPGMPKQGRGPFSTAHPCGHNALKSARRCCAESRVPPAPAPPHVPPMPPLAMTTTATLPTYDSQVASPLVAL